MPWCPKCRNEYREGFTVCADCKVPLVETLDTDDKKKLCTFDNEEYKTKFIKYLEYSKISYFFSFDGENEYISFESSEFVKAEKALRAFVNVEEGLTLKKQIDSTYIVFSSEEVMNALLEQAEGDTEDEKTETIEKEMRKALVSARESSIYESKASKAEEFSGSGYMLIVIGIAGVVYVLLNIFGLLHTVNGLFSEIIMSLMFLGLIAGGFYSLNSSKKYAADAVEEEKLTDTLKDWLKNNLKKSEIEAFDEKDNSSEENYLLRIDGIKSRMKERIPGLESIDENYLDTIVEDYYNETFED